MKKFVAIFMILTLNQIAAASSYQLNETSAPRQEDREESCALSFGFPKTDHLTAAGYRQFACMLGSNNPGCDKDLFQQCLDENQGIAIYEE